MGKEYRKQVEVMSTIKVPTLALLEDDLEATLFKWTGVASTGSSISKGETMVYNGEYAMKCLTRATGATDGDYCHGIRWVKLTNRRHFNLKFVVDNVPIGLSGGILEFNITFWDSLGKGEARIRLDDKLHKLYYYDSNGDWTELSDYTLVNMGGWWYNIEMQIDRVKRTFEYILIGESNPDIKDLKFKNNTGVTGKSYITLQLGVIQNDQAEAASAIAHYDDIILMTPDQ